MSHIEYQDPAEEFILASQLAHKMFHSVNEEEDDIEEWLPPSGKFLFSDPYQIFVNAPIRRIKFELEDSDQHDIDRELSRSHFLLRPPETWGDEDEPGITPATWERMRAFVVKQAAASVRLFGRPLPVPTINPADQGSIDVFWQLDGRELLLNFPAEESEPITYYGQTRTATQTTAGRTTVHDERPDLIAWLQQDLK